jgi:hypothetical protein
MTRRQKVGSFAFFALAFVVVPLFVAKWKAGGNLHSRVHRLWALHISIQSGDPGRLAIEDAEADIAILEELLLPSPRRTARAREFYQHWRQRKDWPVVEIDEPEIQLDPSGCSATARYVLKMRQPYKRREVAYVDTWRKLDGVWYLARRRERPLRTYANPGRGLVRP